MQKLDITCIVSGNETDGRIAGFSEMVAAGSGPPLHRHRSQIEIFHIIEGRFQFEVDGVVSALGAGDSALVPAGAAHAFKNIGKTRSRIHFELLPAGRSEEAFEELVENGDRITDFGAFFDRYDMDLLGPPID